MANILTILKNILTAQYGKDVRQAIHDGIKTCYDEGKAGSTDLTARESIQELTNAINALNSALTTVRTLSPWTLIEYPNNLVEMWRYSTISATDKTNTFSLPTPMKDNQFGVKAFPVFNGHLCHSLWAGSKTGADGRTTTTVQISMDSTDSESNVGIILYITGYKAS